MIQPGQIEKPRFELKIQSKPEDIFYVTRVDGEESISQPYRFTILFTSNHLNLKADDFLHQPAVLKIHASDGTSFMQYSGLVFSFALVKRVNDLVLYEVELRPRLWKLAHNRITDVYCDEKNIPEIVLQKLNESGLTSLSVEQHLRDASVYRKRSLICQFYESDLDFISRYLEAEGIYYYFDQSEEFNEKMVMIDYRQAQPTEKKELLYYDTEDMPTEMKDNRVSALSTRKQITYSKIVVQDYNYRKASLEDSLKSEKQVDPRGIGTCMFWGYNLREPKEAEHMAKIRSEELLCQQFVVSGESTAIQIKSGYFISLRQHFQSDLNKGYLVISVKHRGRQSFAGFEVEKNSVTDGQQVGTQYECSFDAIDEDLQYRSPRKTKWPFVSGTLSGIIDHEGSGKYAQINDNGQYKVQLLFDLTAKNANRGSSWLRMLTPYAGQGHGMAWPLLKGTEVVIGFMGGDPDQPIILGAVSNSENPNVLKSNNSHLGGFQSDAGNYMVVNDKDGEQAVHMWSPGGNTHLYIGKF